MESILLAFLSSIPMALFASATSAASISAEHCYCTTESAWITAAQSQGWGATGYLYSFEGRQLRRFRNGGQIAGTDPVTSGASAAAKSGGTVQSPINPTVTWLPVDAKYEQYFANLLAVRDAVVRPLSAIQVRYELPVDATDNRGNRVGDYNAYDVVNNPAHNLNLTDYLAQKRADVFGNSDLGYIADKLTNLLQALDKVFTKGELLQVTIVVTFPDGSSMEFLDTGTTTIVRVKGSGRDKKNNPILDANTIDGRGSYTIDAGDAEGFVNNMRNLGVDIPGPGTSMGPRVYSCTWNPTKTTLTCRLVSS
jgi:hypothetical protein